MCGACTLLVDGATARSCITSAVACEGAEVTTIEGLDDDPVAAQLRAAFSREHALQCGYCTPGMLATARDIVIRLPDADEKRIRTELSGNLCRCTGYVGIVRAIRAVLAERRTAGAAPVAAGRAELGPVGSPRVIADPHLTPPLSAPGGRKPASLHHAEERAFARAGGEGRGEVGKTVPVASTTAAKPNQEIRQSFTVAHPRDAVWQRFKDPAFLAACLPGAALTAQSGDHVTGEIRIRLGPIAAAFAGEADLVWDDAAYRGSVRGAGRDARSASQARGEIAYALSKADGGAATRIDVTVGFTLAGPLAQFSRSGIVNDLAARLTAEFAKNLEAGLARRAEGGAASEAPPQPAAELKAGALLLSVLWARIKAAVKGLLAR